MYWSFHCSWDNVMKWNVFFFCLLHIFQNFPCMLVEKSKSVSFSRVYVCVKAKLTLVSFFYFFFHAPSPRWFSVIWVPKFLLTPIKIRIFGPKQAKFSQNLPLLAKYWHFWPISSHAQPRNNANTMPWWFFRYVSTKNFASSRRN